MKKHKKMSKTVNLCIIAMIIFYLLLGNFASYAYESEYTVANNLKIDKISNPDAGEGEADGLVDGGDRETSYAWAMAARGQYLYIGTNRNIVGSVADTFVSAMTSAGVTEDIAWGLIDSMTNKEIPRPTTQDGGEIFKCDMLTGKIEKIYTAEAGVAFRMATEFEGNLYFASYSSTPGADNYIYKIDENDDMTIAFTSTNGTSLRASCIYNNSLLFGGVDARTELAEGDEDCQKLAIVKKDANDDTKWDRIADYKDFKDYATDSAVFSTVTSPIWDICTYDGYVYATIPNSAGIAMFKGHPAEGDEPANEYGWYWTEVIGRNNGLNNLGLADTAEGYTGDESGLITMAATPITFNGKLYLMNFDNTISAEVSALTGLVSELAQQDVKPSDYLKTMYTTLQYPQKLWCYDDETGKFNEVEGFSKYMKDNCIEYVWRAETYHDELYITTMDSAVLYNYITNLKGTYFVDLTEEEIDDLIGKIDDLLSMIDTVGSSIEGISEIKDMLVSLQEMLEEYKTVADDNKLFYEFVIKYEDLINQMEALGTDNSNLLEMAGAEFQELYNKVDWEGLKMYAYIAKTLDNSTWGFDLLKTSDGENFEIVTDSGFDDRYNYGGRSLVSTDYGLFVGTANPFYGAQLWRITDGTEENPNPENPGTEDPDPENPGTEDPDPENPGTEDPDPENPGTEDPDPENPGTEDPDPENPDDDKIQDEWQDQLKDPDKLLDDLNGLNNNLGLNSNGQASTSGNQQYSTLAQTKLPAAGNNHILIGVVIGAIVIVLISAYKFLRYRDIDKY